MIKNEDGLVVTALSILCKTGSYKGFVPEIMYVLDLESLTRFMKVFGGETIKVPTPEKFAEDLKISVMAYYKIVEGRDNDWLKVNFNLNGNKINKVNNRIEAWEKKLTEEERAIFMNLKLTKNDGK